MCPMASSLRFLDLYFEIRYRYATGEHRPMWRWSCGNTCTFVCNTPFLPFLVIITTPLIEAETDISMYFNWKK
jgi:hypothetical protein